MATPIAQRPTQQAPGAPIKVRPPSDKTVADLASHMFTLSLNQTSFKRAEAAINAAR